MSLFDDAITIAANGILGRKPFQLPLGQQQHSFSSCDFNSQAYDNLKTNFSNVNTWTQNTFEGEFEVLREVKELEKK